MTLIRKNYDFPMFNNFMEDFFSRDANELLQTKLSIPSVNISESKESYNIEVAAPGYQKEDFSLGLEKDILTISSQKEIEEKTEDKKFTKREFNFSTFQRSFTLPENADREKISAKYENGILVISIEKKEQKMEQGPKTIAIS